MTKQGKELPAYPIDYPTRISDGNEKIGPIPNISFPPGGGSCQPGVPCAREGCYAQKAWRQYATSRRAWTHNWKKLNHNRDVFFEDIHNYLKAKPRQRKFPTFFRWQVSGDVPDQDYLERMKDMAVAHPGVRMMAFTKNYSLRLEGLPHNLTVIPSAWPKLTMPDELIKSTRIAWMYDPNNRDERIQGNYYVCSGACTGCWACWHIKDMEKDVLFHKH
jgi:hypothetical protein